MNSAQITQRLKSLTAWRYNARSRSIWAEIRCRDFMAAVRLIHKIARLAERADHHPDLHLTRYRRLKIVLTTHSEGRVTTKDIRMAQKIARLVKPSTP